jgi:23S rRNA (pseudouridine1915-N3)-methyltransferase
VRIALLTVGKAKRLLAAPIEEFETRARRYFTLDVIEVREEPATRGRDPAAVRAAETQRLLARVPSGYELIALHPTGTPWPSERLAGYLEELGNRASAGAAFAIGGAFGHADELLSRARHRLSLSAMTLPHDLARLVLVEQIYRAGTILRGEPYHKGTER